MNQPPDEAAVSMHSMFVLYTPLEYIFVYINVHLILLCLCVSVAAR